MSQHNKSFLQKLQQGDFGLPKTFWVYWVLPNVALNFFTEKFFYWAVSLRGLLTIIVVATYATCFLVYNLVAIVGIWQSAKKHSGAKLWAILAKLSVASCISLAIFSSCLGNLPISFSFSKQDIVAIFHKAV